MTERVSWNWTGAWRWVGVRGSANVSHHGGGQPFPSWTDACWGCSVQPNPSFSHTVSGLWLETAGREEEEERGEAEETKVGKENEMAGL